MDGMGPSPILSVIHTVAIGTILNNNGDNRVIYLLVIYWYREWYPVIELFLVNRGSCTLFMPVSVLF